MNHTFDLHNTETLSQLILRKRKNKNNIFVLLVLNFSKFAEREWRRLNISYLS